MKSKVKIILFLSTLTLLEIVSSFSLAALEQSSRREDVGIGERAVSGNVTLSTDDGNTQTTFGTDESTAQSEETSTRTPKTEATTLETEGTTSETEVTTFETEGTTFETDETTAQSEETTTHTNRTTPKTEETTLETEGTLSKTDGTTLETEGTTLETEGTTSETDGTTSETDGTSSETEGTTSATDGTTLDTEETTESEATTLRTTLKTEEPTTATETPTTTTETLTTTTERPTTTTESPTNPPDILDPSSLNGTDCPPFNQIYYSLKFLAAVHPGVSLFAEYESFERRPIMLVIVKPYKLAENTFGNLTVKAHVKNARFNKERKSYWMEAGLEGNACGSVTLVLSMIQILALNCQQNCQSDYYFIPVANPDGYEYARTTNSEWIKNREPFDVVPSRRQAGTDKCYGVHINYNFPPEETWSLYGSSDPCSEEHRGPFPGSSREAAAIMRMKHSVPKLTISMTFLQRVGKNFKPKNQIIIVPRAYMSTKIPEYQNYLWNYGKKGRDTINWKGGVFTVLHTFYYVKIQSGTSMDYWWGAQPSCKSYSSRLVMQDETMGIKAQRWLQALTNMIAAIIVEP